MTTTTPSATETSSTTPSSATIVKGGAVGIGLALVANIVVFLIGNAGASLQVVANGDKTPSDLPLGAVIAASLVPLIVGAVGLRLFERFRVDGYRIWVALAAVLAVVSVAAPITMDTDSGSKVALTVMHLATGAAAITGHALARRRRS